MVSLIATTLDYANCFFKVQSRGTDTHLYAVFFSLLKLYVFTICVHIVSL